MENEEIKKDLIANDTEEKIQNIEEHKKSSILKFITANFLDQTIIIACSSVLVCLIDFIMRKAFGYMFVRDNGALILAGGIIYFIINCIYAPIMEKTKAENTIAKKILNMN